jgi:hypothetical protein
MGSWLRAMAGKSEAWQLGRGCRRYGGSGAAPLEKKKCGYGVLSVGVGGPVATTVAKYLKQRRYVHFSSIKSRCGAGCSTRLCKADPRAG